MADSRLPYSKMTSVASSAAPSIASSRPRRSTASTGSHGAIPRPMAAKPRKSAPAATGAASSKPSPMTLLFRREVASLLATAPPNISSDLLNNSDIELLAAIERISSSGQQQSVQLHRVGGERGETWVTRTEGGREWFPRVGRVEKKRVRAASESGSDGEGEGEAEGAGRDNGPEDMDVEGEEHEGEGTTPRASRKKSSTRDERHKKKKTGDGQDQATPRATGPAGNSNDRSSRDAPDAPRRKSRHEAPSRRSTMTTRDYNNDSGDETEREGSVRGRGSKGKQRAVVDAVLDDNVTARRRASKKASNSTSASSERGCTPEEFTAMLSSGIEHFGRGKRRCAGRSEEPAGVVVKTEDFDDLASLCGRVGDLDVQSSTGDGEELELKPTIAGNGTDNPLRLKLAVTDRESTIAPADNQPVASTSQYSA